MVQVRKLKNVAKNSNGQILRFVKTLRFKLTLLTTLDKGSFTTGAMRKYAICFTMIISFPILGYGFKHHLPIIPSLTSFAHTLPTLPSTQERTLSSSLSSSVVWFQPRKDELEKTLETMNITRKKLQLQLKKNLRMAYEAFAIISKRIVTLCIYNMIRLLTGIQTLYVTLLEELFLPTASMIRESFELSKGCDRWIPGIEI